VDGGALADRRFAELLERIAAREPAPGGGSAAACALAIAAALAQMAAAFTLERGEYAAKHPRMAQIHTRAGELRERALELAERELRSYGGLLEALRLPPSEPGRAERVEAARAEAVASPLALCAAASELAQVCAELAREGNRNLKGDAVCGALLAEACCRAAGHLVELNLRRTPDDPRAAQAQALAEQAGEARLQALA
jgi:formiminotetrahydrofolate cyclodeaminase